MLLTEIFNQPAEFTMSVQAPNHAVYQFEVGNQQYYADFQPLGGLLWLFNFFQRTRATGDRMFGGGTPRLTGNAGIKSIEVFSTVIAIMRDFEQKYNPRAIFIAADATEAGRAPLYRRMINRLLPGGWQAFVTTITRDQDPLRTEREGYILTRGVPIARAATSLQTFGITPDQWRPFGERNEIRRTAA